MEMTYLKQAYDDLAFTMGYEFYINAEAAVKRAKMMNHLALLLDLDDRWFVHPDGDHYWLSRQPN